MYPQERELIVDICNRLSAAASQPRDAEAEALIHSRLAPTAETLYALVQAVALQDVALRQAQTRITELERQGASIAAPASGFLGAANPWGTGARTSVPSVPAQPVYAAPVQAPVPPQAGAAPWGQGAGGGFLRGVAGTALGVAGGAMLAQGLSSLFGGHLGGVGGTTSPQNVENVTVNNYYDGDAPADGATDDGWQDDGSGTDDGSTDI